MNDFDYKDIEKYRKQAKKEMKKNARADGIDHERPRQRKGNDDRRLSFERRAKDEPLSFSEPKAVEEHVQPPALTPPLSNSSPERENDFSSPHMSEGMDGVSQETTRLFVANADPLEENAAKPGAEEMTSPTDEISEYPLPEEIGGLTVELAEPAETLPDDAEIKPEPVPTPASVEFLEFIFDEDAPQTPDRFYGAASFEDAIVAEAVSAERIVEAELDRDDGGEDAGEKEASSPCDVDAAIPGEDASDESVAVAAVADEPAAAKARPRFIAGILRLFRPKQKKISGRDNDASAPQTADIGGADAMSPLETVIAEEPVLRQGDSISADNEEKSVAALSDSVEPDERIDFEKSGIVYAGSFEDTVSLEERAANVSGDLPAAALIAKRSSFNWAAYPEDVVFGYGVSVEIAYIPEESAAAAVVSSGNDESSFEKARFSKALEKIFVPRFVAILILTLTLLGPLFALRYYGEFCYLSDEGEIVQGETVPVQKVVWTDANSPREIAAEIVELKEADKVEVEEFGSTKILTVVRSYPVTLTVDGATETHHVLEHSVADLLETAAVSLSEDDLLSHDYSHVLSEGDAIVVQRVMYEYREAIEDVPFKTVMKNSPVLREGNENIAQTGVDGVAARIYLDRYVDGEFTSSEIVEEEVVEAGRDEIIVTGDPTVPASAVDGSRYTDIEIVDGAPTEYERIIDGAICTAYSFGPGTFGASGMRLIQGFVAVNPDVIPYGTLMYIASDRFTYGWAVAADCGTAMMEGYVDIDCYFETYNESAMFGKKALDVYIVKQLTQAELEEYASNGMFYGRVPASVASEG